VRDALGEKDGRCVVASEREPQIIVMDAVDAAGAGLLAARARQALEQALAGEPARVSFAMASYPEDGKTGPELLELAGQRLAGPTTVREGITPA
jgi:hypothetical protein